MDKAVAAKYDVSSVEGGDNYKSKDGTIYHDCQVNLTQVANNHISIESMNCAKGENLTPVKEK